jgi:hypothetical protein
MRKGAPDLRPDAPNLVYFRLQTSDFRLPGSSVCARYLLIGPGPVRLRRAGRPRHGASHPPGRPAGPTDRATVRPDDSARFPASSAVPPAARARSPSSSAPVAVPPDAPRREVARRWADSEADNWGGRSGARPRNHAEWHNRIRARYLASAARRWVCAAGTSARAFRKPVAAFRTQTLGSPSREHVEDRS